MLAGQLAPNFDPAAIDSMGAPAYFVKTDVNGTVMNEWLWWTDHKLGEKAKCAIETDDGDIVAVGQTYTAYNNREAVDIFVLKLPTTVSVSTPPALLPSNLYLVGVAPNPFNAQAGIVYRITDPGEVAIEIFNMLGQRVYETTRLHSSAGQHSLVWNASDHASGVYMARVSGGGHSATARMTLVK